MLAYVHISTLTYTYIHVDSMQAKCDLYYMRQASVLFRLKRSPED
jgi:hypothetical protein